MAFTFTVTGIKQLGQCKLMYGTWDAASVAVGNITLDGLRNPPSAALTTTTATNTTLTTSGSFTTALIQEGDLVIGTGITAGTWVASVESATSLTLNQAATDGSAASRTFTRVKGPQHALITAKAVSSVSSTTMTGMKLIAKNNTIALTPVQDDAGYWSAYLG